MTKTMEPAMKKKTEKDIRKEVKKRLKKTFEKKEISYQVGRYNRTDYPYAVNIATDLKGLTFNECVSKLEEMFEHASSAMGVTKSKVIFQRAGGETYFETTRMESDEEMKTRFDKEVQKEIFYIVDENKVKKRIEEDKKKRIKRLENELKLLKKD